MYTLPIRMSLSIIFCPGATDDAHVLYILSYIGTKDGKLMLVTELVSCTLRQFLDEHHVGVF